MYQHSKSGKPGEVIQLENVISKFTAGRRQGDNLATLSADMFSNFCRGFTGQLTDKQIDHLLEAAWDEREMRVRLQHYSKGN